MRLAIAALLVLPAVANAAAIVIAHRGASGERPEHTLAAYELAAAQGADFIELDLVATRDGALISRHENALAMVELDPAGRIVRDDEGRPVVREATTDVAGRPEFADRLTVKEVDGRPVGGWFSEDFTLAEIRRLRAVERMPTIRPRNVAFDGRFPVPTLEDVIRFLRSAGLERPPGLYLELKHPTYFRYEGRRLDGEPIAIDLAERLLDALVASDFVDPARVYVQCFEVAPLIELKDRMVADGLSLPLIQLFGDVSNRRYRAIPRDVAFNAARGETDVYGDLNRLIPGGVTADTSYAELATLDVLGFMARRYAAGIGPNRVNVLELRTGENGLEFTGALTPLLERAVTAGLVVHPWTLRAEPQFLFRYGADVLTVNEEVRLLLANGAGGFFIDQPALGRAAVDEFLNDDKEE